MEPHQQIHIVATTEEGTRGALVEASDLASRLHPARVVLLVPQFITSHKPTDDPNATAFIREQHRQLASDAGLAATVRVCVCRRYTELFRWMVSKEAVVIVGGRRRWWWPTRAQRLARYLEREGHDVVFADVS